MRVSVSININKDNNTSMENTDLVGLYWKADKHLSTIELRLLRESRRQRIDVRPASTSIAVDVATFGLAGKMPHAAGTNPPAQASRRNDFPFTNATDAECPLHEYVVLPHSLLSPVLLLSTSRGGIAQNRSTWIIVHCTTLLKTLEKSPLSLKAAARDGYRNSSSSVS